MFIHLVLYVWNSKVWVTKSEGIYVNVLWRDLLLIKAQLSSGTLPLNLKTFEFLKTGTVWAFLFWKNITLNIFFCRISSFITDDEFWPRTNEIYEPMITLYVYILIFLDRIIFALFNLIDTFVSCLVNKNNFSFCKKLSHCTNHHQSLNVSNIFI